MAKSPVAILFTTDGVEVGVEDGTALPADARGFIGVGYDGTNTQFISVDSSGRQRIIGAAAQGAAVAGDPVLVAGWDGTNVRVPRLYDADTGGGTEYTLGVVLRKSASGGSVELGTSADPIRTDPTGTTPQPVSGTVTADQGAPALATSPWPVRASDGSAFINVALEHVTAGSPHAVRLTDGSSFYDGTKTGQLPAALVGGRLDTNIGAWFGSTTPTVGQKAMSASLPVVISSDQSTLPVTGVGVVDAGNSSTTPLGSSATFTGTGIDVSGYTVIIVSVFADNDGTLKLQFSPDNTNWDVQVQYPIASGVGESVRSGPQARYFRVVYENSSGAQSAFRLQTIERTLATIAPILPISATVDGSDDAALTKSVITGKTTGGGGAYVDVKVSPSGAVQVGGTVDATQSGTWTVQQGSPPWQVVGPGAAGAAVTGNPVIAGGSDGTNARYISVDTSGRQVVVQPTASLLNATVTQGPAAALSGAWPVQITDGTNAADVLVDNGSRKRLRAEAMIVDGETANPVFISTRRKALVTGHTRLVGGNNYGGALDTTIWTATVTGSGTVSTGSGLATLANGVTSNSTATLTSVATGPNVSGTLNEYFAGVRLADTGVTNNTRTWGVADAIVPTEGLFFELSGTTFRLRFRNNSSDTIVNNGSFNGNYGPTLTIDTNFHTWKLVYNAGTVSAYVDNKLLHTYTPSTQAIAGTVDFLLFAATTNTGGLSTTQNLIVRGQTINRHGQADTTRLTDAISDTFVAPLTRTVLTGKTGASNYVNVAVDSSGRIITAPPGANSAKGFATGDVALSSVTTSVVRRTTYNEQTTNAQRSISSANAADASAGTGARQVKITYYDATGAGPSTETVTLSGTTPVNTVSSTICFIEKMEVVSVGSGGQNAGIITLFVSTAGGGGTLGTIAAGDNKTFWTHHYVPTGKTANITSLSVVVNGGGALFFVRAKTIGVSTAVDLQVSDYVRSATQSGTNSRNYGTPIQVVGPSRLLMYVTTEANTSLTYRGSFDFYDE